MGQVESGEEPEPDRLRNRSSPSEVTGGSHGEHEDRAERDGESIDGYAEAHGQEERPAPVRSACFSSGGREKPEKGREKDDPGQGVQNQVFSVALAPNATRCALPPIIHVM